MHVATALVLVLARFALAQGSDKIANITVPDTIQTAFGGIDPVVFTYIFDAVQGHSLQNITYELMAGRSEDNGQTVADLIGVEGRQTGNQFSYFVHSSTPAGLYHIRMNGTVSPTGTNVTFRSVTTNITLADESFACTTPGAYVPVTGLADARYSPVRLTQPAAGAVFTQTDLGGALGLIGSVLTLVDLLFDLRDMVNPTLEAVNVDTGFATPAQAVNHGIIIDPSIVPYATKNVTVLPGTWKLRLNFTATGPASTGSFSTLSDEFFVAQQAPCVGLSGSAGSGASSSASSGATGAASQTSASTTGSGAQTAGGSTVLTTTSAAPTTTSSKASAAWRVHSGALSSYLRMDFLVSCFACYRDDLTAASDHCLLFGLPISSPMTQLTPEEAATLHGLGLDWIQIFVSIMNETVWITIYTIIVFQACVLLLDKSRRSSWTSRFYLLGILILYFGAIVQWVLDMVGFISEAKLSLVLHPDGDIGENFGEALKVVLKVAAVQDAIFAYLTLLGDAIIIHRVWKLRAYRYVWIFLVLIGAWIGSAVGTFMLTYCVAVVGSDIVLGTFQNPALCRNAQTVTYVLPCATTAIATVLIALTAWRYAHATQLLTSSRRTSARNPVAEILLLLVESGLVYLFFFVALVIEVAPIPHAWIDASPFLSLAFKIYTYCSSVIIGIYPTSLVVLSHSKYAVLDSGPATDIISTFHIRAVNAAGITSTTIGATSSGGVTSIADRETKFDEEGNGLELRLRSNGHVSRSAEKVNVGLGDGDV
ncbi:unnamed protein product [Mycena citricolor]|uniref:Uncharacterized protein n=1 Tax=Mycena citricolor TaxID=2018698 RepID=A0AAD2H8G6_9AGAR|nr:unnamed protein product [Mycena citricolor]